MLILLDSYSLNFLRNLFEESLCRANLILIFDLRINKAYFNIKYRQNVQYLLAVRENTAKYMIQIPSIN